MATGYPRGSCRECSRTRVNVDRGGRRTEGLGAFRFFFKEWTDCVTDDLRLFGVTGDWRTAALDSGAWYNTVQEGGCRFMAAWVREEENASNQRQKKRETEERGGQG